MNPEKNKLKKRLTIAGIFIVAVILILSLTAYLVIRSYIKKMNLVNLDQPNNISDQEDLYIDEFVIFGFILSCIATVKPILKCKRLQPIDILKGET
jgi:ABC-type lipoprotein release transport system permease subunit